MRTLEACKCHIEVTVCNRGRQYLKKHTTLLSPSLLLGHCMLCFKWGLFFPWLCTYHCSKIVVSVLLWFHSFVILCFKIYTSVHTSVVTFYRLVLWGYEVWLESNWTDITFYSTLLTIEILSPSMYFLPQSLHLNLPLLDNFRYLTHVDLIFECWNLLVKIQEPLFHISGLFSFSQLMNSSQGLYIVNLLNSLIFRHPITWSIHQMLKNIIIMAVDFDLDMCAFFCHNEPGLFQCTDWCLFSRSYIQNHDSH